MLRTETVTPSTLELLKELMEDDNLNDCFSIEDIAAMKLNAIMGNGTRLKDFIDISFLSTKLSLKTMVDAYGKKYYSRNPVLTIKALLFYNDYNFNEPIHLVNGVYSWKPIAKRLSDMEKFPKKIFNSRPFLVR